MTAPTLSSLLLELIDAARSGSLDGSTIRIDRAKAEVDRRFAELEEKIAKLEER